MWIACEWSRSSRYCSDPPPHITQLSWHWAGDLHGARSSTWHSNINNVGEMHAPAHSSLLVYGGIKEMKSWLTPPSYFLYGKQEANIARHSIQQAICIASGSNSITATQAYHWLASWPRALAPYRTHLLNYLAAWRYNGFASRLLRVFLLHRFLNNACLEKHHQNLFILLGMSVATITRTHVVHLFIS